MSRILVVPHAPATGLRTRAGELARALAADGHEVDVYARNLQPRGLSLPGKVIWHLREINPRVRRAPLAADPAQTARAIHFPTAHRAAPLIWAADTYAARRIHALDYDLILNSAYGGISPEHPRGGRLVYDLVDDHAAGWRHAGDEAGAKSAERYVDRAIRRADQVIASSRVLVDLAKSRYGREATLIPNGADVTGIRARPRAPAPPVKVGYVGGLDGFVRIDWIVRALEKIRAGGREVGLVIVGHGPAIEGWDIPAWVERLGFRKPAEIPALLDTFRVGVVPFEVSPYTDAALPLKVLEYGAAERITVSSPLAELRHHRLPWVSYAGAGESDWAEALAAALDRAWDPAWDILVDRYDWRASARKLLEICRNPS